MTRQTEVLLQNMTYLSTLGTHMKVAWIRFLKIGFVLATFAYSVKPNLPCPTLQNTTAAILIAQPTGTREAIRPCLGRNRVVKLCPEVV